MSGENVRDPRTRLVREKYFSLRPKPLERWLWTQGVPPAAERVFWLHWQEGLQRGDWCSEIPLKRVALECCVDLSTVTKAYQLLARLGCIRRTDPGRDPANPFQQAIAVTEVRMPRELLIELDRHPNRRAMTTAPRQQPMSGPAAAPEESAPRSEPRDPFAGLSGRERLKAMSALERAMSTNELSQYREALRTRQAHFSFDPESKLSAADRGQVLQLLSVVASEPARAVTGRCITMNSTTSLRRELSVFELARLRRDIQVAVGSLSGLSAPELLRQVVWAIEQGSLNRFATTHAIHIALKKIREGAWTRPHRMPPNWSRGIGVPSVPETCRRA
jgi:hypothetical protein